MISMVLLLDMSEVSLLEYSCISSINKNVFESSIATACFMPVRAPVVHFTAPVNSVCSVFGFAVTFGSQVLKVSKSKARILQ